MISMNRYFYIVIINNKIYIDIICINTQTNKSNVIIISVINTSITLKIKININYYIIVNI